ncbi:hypothetical protein B0J12DRAFT_785970 [Macrophomina phaseolina]|uniref:Secreted protein n=1 Tax=Macrophomina phaseolina TaxID=35725 RepID=A0ABQ8G9R3_9PEZI|nr:hypothetical protein B0J12DRAFT_785970 [Macrophomina phaseolina]
MPRALVLLIAFLPGPLPLPAPPEILLLDFHSPERFRASLRSSLFVLLLQHSAALSPCLALRPVSCSTVSVSFQVKFQLTKVLIAARNDIAQPCCGPACALRGRRRPSPSPRRSPLPRSRGPCECRGPRPARGHRHFLRPEYRLRLRPEQFLHRHKRPHFHQHRTYCHANH